MPIISPRGPRRLCTRRLFAFRSQCGIFRWIGTTAATMLFLRSVFLPLTFSKPLAKLVRSREGVRIRSLFGGGGNPFTGVLIPVYACLGRRDKCIRVQWIIFRNSFRAPRRVLHGILRILCMNFRVLRVVRFPQFFSLRNSGNENKRAAEN